MIEINLLPEAYRIVKKSKGENIPLTLILLSVNGLLLVVFLIVTAVNVSRILTLSALDTRLKGLAPEQQKIIVLQQKTANFKTTNALFAPFVERKYLWAQKLNLISDLVMPGVWLREVSLEQNSPAAVPNQPSGAQAVSTNELKIEATVVSVGQDEMAIIGEFINNLKSSDKFMNDFKTIELENSLRRQLSIVEVMDFTLVCQFKEDVNL